jgi:hypothetical protein
VGVGGTFDFELYGERGAFDSLGVVYFVAGVVAEKECIVAQIDVTSAIRHFFGKIGVENDDVFGLCFVDGNNENGDVEIEIGECVFDNFDFVLAHVFVVMDDETIGVLNGIFVLNDGIFDGAGLNGGEIMLNLAIVVSFDESEIVFGKIYLQGLEAVYLFAK